MATPQTTKKIGVYTEEQTEDTDLTGAIALSRKGGADGYVDLSRIQTNEGKLETINRDVASETYNDTARAVGSRYRIRKINSGAGTITINAPGGYTYTSAGLSSVTLTSDGDYWEFEVISSSRIDLVGGTERISGSNEVVKYPDGRWYNVV